MVSLFKGQLTVLSLLLVIICAFLLYSWIDARVTIDHARQEQEYQSRRINLLENMLQVTGGHLSRSEMILLFKKRFGKDHIIKEDGDKIQVDNILFKFKDDSFEGLEFVD
jgi:hypothetical protein